MVKLRGYASRNLAPLKAFWLDYWFPVKHDAKGSTALLLFGGGFFLNIILFWLPVFKDIVAAAVGSLIDVNVFYMAGQFLTWAIMGSGIWMLHTRGKTQVLRFYDDEIYSVKEPLRRTWDWPTDFRYTQENDGSHDIAIDMRTVKLPRRDFPRPAGKGHNLEQPYSEDILKARHDEIMETAIPFEITAEPAVIDSGDLHERMHFWEMFKMHMTVGSSNLPMAFGTLLVVIGGMAFLLYDIVNRSTQ